LRVANRDAATICAALSAGASTFGHETLSSIALTSAWSSSREQISA
jgi:hypothetical protein